jgi:ferredoxin
VLAEPGEVSSKDTDQVGVDREACMGSGNCVFWAPGVFDLDEDGVAVVCGDPAGREEEVRQALRNCPTSAISIRKVAPR